MLVIHRVATIVGFAFAVAACGGQVDSPEPAPGPTTASTAENVHTGCPSTTPSEGGACPGRTALCEYPLVGCASQEICRCSPERGWTCTRPAECVVH